MPEKAPIAFISYDTIADANNSVTTLREKLEDELHIRLERDDWIFQDKESIRQGQEWQKRIDKALADAKILVPIITPSLFRRPPCRKELETFSNRKSAAGGLPPVLPVLFVETPGIRIADRTSGAGASDPHPDPLVSWLAKYQCADWTKLRLQDKRDENYSTAVSALADRLEELAAKVSPVPQPETRERKPEPEPELEPEPDAESTPVKRGSNSFKRWVATAVFAVIAVAAVAGVRWALIDFCRGTLEPYGICTFVPRESPPEIPPELTESPPSIPPQPVSPTLAPAEALRPKPLVLARLDGRFSIVADKPVIAHAEPSADAKVIEELFGGYVFEPLWRDENTGWYAYDTIDGERAFFQGDVIQRLEAP